MANKTVVAAGGNFDSAAVWNPVGVPITGDDIIADIASGNLNINVISADSFDSWDTTGYTNTMSGVADVVVAGNLLIDAGCSLTHTGVWTQAADGNVSNPALANIFHNLSRGDGVDSTFTGRVWAERLSGAGRIILNDQKLGLAPGAVNDFYTATCTYTATTGKVEIYGGAADQTNAAAMDFGAVKVDYGKSGSARQLAVAGRFTCGTLWITGTGVNISRLVANGGLDASGLVTLGTNATAKFGGLTLAGSCSLGAGLVCAGTSVANELNLGSAYLSLTGEIDGVNAAAGEVVFTNTAARIVGGTLTDCDLTGQAELTTFGTTLNGCTNITNDTHAVPHSFGMMGMGI